jgi:hypothetical protein
MLDEQPQVPREEVEQPGEVVDESAGDSSLPQPVREEKSTLRRALPVAVGVVLGGVIFVLLGLDAGACRGASRSARLRWQERDQEIEKARQEEQTPSQVVPSKSSAPAPDASHE